MQPIKRIGIFCTLGIALLAAQALPVRAQEEASSSVTTGAPIEQMIFDMYVGGRFSGNVVTNFTDEWVEFSEPEDAVDQIPMVKDHTVFIPLFEKRVSKDEPYRIPGIGEVKVDPYFFRVDVTPHPSRVVVQNIQVEDGELPPPQDTLAIRQGVRLAASTDFDPVTAYSASLAHNSVVSKGEWRGIMRGALIKRQGYEVNDLAISKDVDESVLTAGLIETRGTAFAYSRPILGVELSTSRERIRSGGYTPQEGTPIQVFVPSRSLVRIFRNSQLIFSRNLEFGMQEIDTRNFPDGNYEVRIEVTDLDGNTTEEFQPFVKNNELLPFDEPLHTFQFGVLRNNVDASSTPVAQYSANWRATDFFELEGSIYGGEELILFEPRIKGFFGDFTFEGAYSHSSKNDTAVLGDVRFDRDGWLWNVRAQHTLTGHDPAPFTQTDDDELRFADALSEGRTNIQGNVLHTFGDLQIGLSGRYNKGRVGASTSSEQYSYGPKVVWRPINTQTHQFRTELSHYRLSGGRSTYALANYKYRPNRKWSIDNRITREHSGGTNASAARAVVNYNDRDFQSQGTSFLVGSELQRGEKRQTNSNYTLTHQGSDIQLRSSGQYNAGDKNKDGDTRNASVEGETNFIYTDGDTEMIAAPTGRSLVLVNVTGNALGTPMKVMVNDRPRGLVHVGETLALGLTPYRSYNITLQPDHDGELVTFDSTPYQITLYPENVGRHTWEVDQVRMLTGRLLNDKGEAIRWQRIKGLRGFGSTDGSGNFQIEVVGDETPYIFGSKAKCTVALPNIQFRELFYHVGDVACL